MTTCLRQKGNLSKFRVLQRSELCGFIKLENLAPVKPIDKNDFTITAHMLWLYRLASELYLQQHGRQRFQLSLALNECCDAHSAGAVAELVGNEGGVVSGVFNLESSGVEASDWRPRHDEHYHEA